VRIETDGDVITGKEGTFNLNTQTGEIIEGRLFIKANHYYLSGSQMQKTGENTYVINNCTITTCDGDNPDWTITGSEVKVTIEGYGTVKHSAFRIRDLPFIYMSRTCFFRQRQSASPACSRPNWGTPRSTAQK
jgi:LPS-assembly protein